MKSEMIEVMAVSSIDLFAARSLSALTAVSLMGTGVLFFRGPRRRLSLAMGSRVELRPRALLCIKMLLVCICVDRGRPSKVEPAKSTLDEWSSARTTPWVLPCESPFYDFP